MIYKQNRFSNQENTRCCSCEDSHQDEHLYSCPAYIGSMLNYDAPLYCRQPTRIKSERKTRILDQAVCGPSSLMYVSDTAASGPSSSSRPSLQRLRSRVLFAASHPSFHRLGSQADPRLYPVSPCTPGTGDLLEQKMLIPNVRTEEGSGYMRCSDVASIPALLAIWRGKAA
ncbi:hypothetical protein NDU88_003759 [Pleurodeles waltl]|uniref:Uncharacterized protein n=1 Tax=Pleurodeles waltl TaxID=8319 RepID=A0AAV7RE17_PLEWA|nr:hypothetical protein NDU88_003759 [Pleurodeles waltl]